ncbi:MAG: hypothetical protein QGH51_10640, partial [Planctomycetota bacterium]|nr:hypothetical protein [Planctomycetota bacterium]
MKYSPLLLWMLLSCASSLPQPGVFSGADSCTLVPFMGVPAGNEIQTLTNLGGGLIWTCSKNGAWLIGQNGRVLKSLSFERSCARAVPVDSNSDGIADFFADRGRGWSDVAVLNLDGSTRWVFDGGGLAAPNDLC